MTTIALSLVSHTNVGKTTLARTLLGRDIGEVRDEAHVTHTAERHTMVETPQGDRLELWDTPGFGDSVRLAKRLQDAGNPIGWFMAEVWDRFRHRAFWSSQRAARNVLEQADAVLYLVNASEAPDDAGYIDAELQVLRLLGKPVVVLLNQLGPPQPPAQEAAQIQLWRTRLARDGGERQVLALDAFARCWVQEGTLLRAVASALPSGQQATFERLQAAWAQRSREVWHASMAELAQRLVRAALDREQVQGTGWTSRIKDFGAAVGAGLGIKREGGHSARDLAMQQLTQRLERDVRASTDRLIRLHGLSGSATEAVLTRVAEQFALREPLNEGKAALWGGAAAGALAGLKADIATGGLTLGGGLLAGGVLGALGAAGLARGVNLVRGVDAPSLAWSDGALDEMVHSALLAYLNVAHYGRGRGDWAASEHPAFWVERVGEVLKTQREVLHELWSQRADAVADAAHAESMEAALRHVLVESSGELLERLYPGAGAGLTGFIPRQPRSASSAP